MAVECNTPVIVRLVLVGSSSVGKTSLINRFVEDSFVEGLSSTIGVDVKFRSICVDGVRVKLQIWDATGQERFKDITKCYYRGSHGILLVYDTTSEESFRTIQREWLTQVRGVVGTRCALTLLGNKSPSLEGDDKLDGESREEMREVSVEEATEFATANNMNMIETSAKNGRNVEQAFADVVRDALRLFFPPEELTAERSVTTQKEEFVKQAMKKPKSRDDDNNPKKTRTCFCWW